ncbi:E3 ubiquitin-protein ligase DA2-like isoform X2 [Wolffia australiana]
MGNKLGSKRLVVEEKYTRPQGLYQNAGVDYKKLRNLILRSRLAPCYPGEDEGSSDREECPICFLYYPSLNRSRCCMKGICTECFLQMKPSRSTRSTQCPFCKRLNYGVDYRGMRTKEEKGLEQIEEQKVIEAKMRMQQEQLEEEKRKERSRVAVLTSEIVPSSSSSGLNDWVGSPRGSPLPAQRRLLQPRQNRSENVDLEDLMLMEAIWLSIQESGPGVETRESPDPSGSADGPSLLSLGCNEVHSPTAGLARAVASLAEIQFSAAEALPPQGTASGRGEGFEEQMMLAMAISLARSRSSSSDTMD